MFTRTRAAARWNRRGWRSHLGVGLLWIASGCASQSPLTQLETAESWASTTRELAIQRRVDGVGRTYAAQLLDAGRRSVRKTAEAIDAAQLPSDTRPAVSATLTRLDSLMRRTAESVRRGDLVALGIHAAAADTLAHTLHALRERLGGG